MLELDQSVLEFFSDIAPAPVGDGEQGRAANDT